MKSIMSHILYGSHCNSRYGTIVYTILYRVDTIVGTVVYTIAYIHASISSILDYVTIVCSYSYRYTTIMPLMIY